MTDIRIPEPFTREDLLAACDRELRYRERVFPRRVEAGHMSLAESVREMSRMKAVRAVIAQLPATQPTLPFDSKACAAGNDR